MNGYNASMYGPLSLLSAASIGYGLSLLYPVLTSRIFASIPEAEVHVYVLGIGIYLVTLTVLRLRQQRDLVRHPSKIHAGSRWTIAGFLMLVGSIVLFVSQDVFQRPTAALTEHIRQMGIYLTSLPLAVWLTVLGSITYMLFIFSHRFRFPKVVYPPIIISTVIAVVWLTWYVGPLNFYDTTHYIGPIHDTRMGIPLLTSPTWYGFFPILLMSALFRIIPLTLLNFSILIASVQTVGLLLFFFFQLWLFKSLRWSVAGIFLAVLFHFLVQYGFPNLFPQATFIRFGIWMAVAAALYWRAGTHHRGIWPTITLALAIGLTFFWTTDMGVYVLAAYISTIWLCSITHSIPQAIRSFTRYIIPALFGIGIFFAGISLSYFMMYETFPVWSNFWNFAWGYTTIREFALPMPHSVIPIVFLSIPVITLTLALLGNYRDCKSDPERTVIVFLSLVTLFSFTYFAGDSHLNALHSINLPVIICFIWLIREFLQWAKTLGTLTLFAACFLVASLTAAPIVVWGNQAVVTIRNGTIRASLRTLRDPKPTERELYGPTAEAIAVKYQPALATGDFAVISIHDTWYLLLWNTTNALGSNCLRCYWTPDMAKPLRIGAQHLSVRYVFVDRDQFDYEARVSWVFTPEVKKRYRFVETIGNLDVYEKI